jgi:hypothetical protein
MDQLELEKLLLESKKITNENKKLSLFFNNSSMGKILDVLLNNPNSTINIMDALYKAGLSRKAIQVNVGLLLENNIITEEHIRYYKFYKLNKKNSLVKQITQFRDILLVNNVFIEKRRPTTRESNKKESNRRVNTKLQQGRRTKQSKNGGKSIQEKPTYSQ